jgi:hypothetical protein
VGQPERSLRHALGARRKPAHATRSYPDHGEACGKLPKVQGSRLSVNVQCTEVPVL